MSSSTGPAQTEEALDARMQVQQKEQGIAALSWDKQYSTFRKYQVHTLYGRQLTTGGLMSAAIGFRAGPSLDLPELLSGQSVAPATTRRFQRAEIFGICSFSSIQLVVPQIPTYVRPSRIFNGATSFFVQQPPNPKSK